MCFLAMNAQKNAPLLATDGNENDTHNQKSRQLLR